MLASRTVAGTAGVRAALIAMATPLNVELAQGMGFDVPPAVPAELLIAVRADDEASIEAALATLTATLTARSISHGVGNQADPLPATTGAALADSDAALALISVPGQHAATEAFDAVAAGRSVMIFSDGVTVEDEIALKRAGRQAGVLVMGPDCGTAIVGGIALGFANVVRRGPVGIVAASGTGAQQVSSLLETAGVGVSHLLGLGGRDLSASVGGMAAELALIALDADPATELIVLVSKPPDSEVAQALLALTAELSTPVQFALLGAGQPDLTQAAEAALQALDAKVPDWPVVGKPQHPRQPARLHGYFAGGTLATETLVLIRELGTISTNLGPDALPAADALAGESHVVVDFGEDELTSGRAHPMIDPTMRLDQIAQISAAGSGNLVLLLDVVLGYGAEPAPAQALVPALRAAAAASDERDDQLDVVVSLCGTESDPQVWSEQAEALSAAGALVFASNAQAARHALALAHGATASTVPQ
ncbi:MAG: FdrA family protein [Actinomycetota bacterium]|nr:FdrA family protein [Actinomycetota bacterium]